MNRWAAIRQHAARVLAQFEERVGHSAFDETAGSYAHLKSMAWELYGLTVAPDDELPENVSGFLDLDEMTISYRAHEDATRQHFTIGHDLGHCALEHPLRVFTEAAERFDDTPHAESLLVRNGIYRAYSEHDRWELEANIFAAELLAPLDRVSALVQSNSDWTVDALARYFGLSRGAMFNRLAALFSMPATGAISEGKVRSTNSVMAREPQLTDRAPTSETAGVAPPVPPLDSSQERAVTVSPPALVIAGPGAGKTRVLVERFASLVRNGVPPRRILAITFANKAAEEMRERLAALIPENAHLIQVATFHSLGLELLQAYGHHLGLGRDPQLLTKVDAFVFLRRRLGEFPLGSFEDVRHPTGGVMTLLTTISRAKDELAGPEEFAQLTAAWQRELDGRPEPEDDHGRELLEAERTMCAASADAAAAYAIYQGWMREAGYLDFGDLVSEAVRLLEEPNLDEIASEVREQYDHILVDEMQDINYASGRLIRALDGGRGIIWAVCDPRQSIFRFRGASPTNLRNFMIDYPAAQVISLEWNYRSVEDIVAAGQMVRIPQSSDGGHLVATPLKPYRAKPSREPAIELVVAPTGRDEVAAVVDRIEALASSMPIGQIAVLCRTTAQVQRYSDALEARDIPTDWGGAITERAMFKDLCGVLLLVADDPRGLVRVASMAEHELGEADLRLLLAGARTRGGSAHAALYAACSGELAGLSAPGREQAMRLKQLVGDLGHQPTPWHALAAYLFESARWTRALFHDDSPQARRYRSTIGQVSNLAREFSERTDLVGGADIAAFLEYVRWSMEANEPVTSDDMLVSTEAVHVLTAHRSKGLEWPVVFVPELAEGHFPRGDNHDPLPLPPGLIRGACEADGREVEEACLFYVAVTRACDRLILSYALKYANRKPGRSCLLDGFADSLEPEGYLIETVAPAAHVEHPLTLPTTSATRRLEDKVWAFEGDVPFGALKRYDECPQRAEFEYVYGLRSPDRGYLALRDLVHGVMAWATEQAVGGIVPNQAAAEAEVSARWADTGLAGHWFEGAYRRQAERIVQVFVGRLRPGIRIHIREKVILLVNGRPLTVTVDEIEEDGASLIWRVHHFGRLPKKRPDEHKFALFSAAHFQDHGTRPHDVRLHDLLHGVDVPADQTPTVISNRTRKMHELITKMEAGQFTPKPSLYRCPTCYSNLVCSQKIGQSG